MTTYHYISESAPKFRIGGVYRQKNGRLVGLRDDKYNPDPGTAWVHRIGSDFGEGFRCLTTGADSIQLDGDGRDLIPGELTLRDGQWVPLERTASLTFPGGGCVQLAGDKVIGRVEAEPTVFVPSGTYSDKCPSGVIVTILGGGGGGGNSGGSATGIRPATEPKRAPLDWNTTTRHDTFGPDFIVTKGAEPTAPLYDSPTTDSAYPAIAGLLRG